MRYLFQHIWLCLILAAVIGGIIGWLLRHLSCRRHIAALQSASGSVAPSAASSASTPTASQPDAYEIEEIEGIGKGYGKALRNMGLTTTGELLERCYNTHGQDDVASLLSLGSKTVYGWACMADLLRVPGIQGQDAELLYWAGIVDVDALARQKRDALYETLTEINAQQNRARIVADAGTLARWIAAAGDLDSKMSH